MRRRVSFETSRYAPILKPWRVSSTSPRVPNRASDHQPNRRWRVVRSGSAWGALLETGKALNSSRRRLGPPIPPKAGKYGAYLFLGTLTQRLNKAQYVRHLYWVALGFKYTENARPMMMSTCQQTSRAWALAIAAASALLLPTIAAAQTPAAGRPQPTFTKDVAPILQRSCVTCHRAGEMAPMALMTYEDARPWARAIKTRTSSRDAAVAHRQVRSASRQFKNDPSLSDEEIATIAKWVDAGAPRGNPADMPPPRQFADASAWQIGKPDIVDQVPGLQGAGGRPGSLRQPLRRHPDRPRIATSRRFRPAPRRRLAQGRASRAVVRRRRAGRGRERRRQRGRRRRRSSSSSTPRARTPRCIRATPACCCRPARRRWSATTCTRSARRPRPTSSWR